MASTLLKCDDCQKYDGLFQCCHCQQHLCIRCCNKHHKKVTIELEQLHTLTDRLMNKVVHVKNDLERQKNEALEQCHKWRLDTINIINRAHQLVLQTIHHEYENLSKDYEDFVEKEMAHINININIDKNHLSRMKRDNVGSLISSLSVTPTESDADNSLDSIRQRIEAFAKQIDETGKVSFQVILPNIELHETPKVESRFGDVTRSSSIAWENEAVDEEPPPPRPSTSRRHTHTFHRTLSIPPSFIIQPDPRDSFDETQRYDGIIARRRRRTMTSLSSRLSSMQNERLLRQSWFYNPVVATASPL